MATALKNLSEYNKELVPNGADFKVGIVVSEWNDQITFNLLKGAQEALLENGVKEENIYVQFVTGAFELPLGSQYFWDMYFRYFMDSKGAKALLLPAGYCLV